MNKKVGFQHLVGAVVIMLCLRAFFVGPFEPCFFIATILSLNIVYYWQGRRRTAGIALLVVSLVGLVWDIVARLDERRTIKEKHERLQKFYPP